MIMINKKVWSLSKKIETRQFFNNRMSKNKI